MIERAGLRIERCGDSARERLTSIIFIISLHVLYEVTCTNCKS